MSRTILFGRNGQRIPEVIGNGHSGQVQEFVDDVEHMAESAAQADISRQNNHAARDAEYARECASDPFRRLDPQPGTRFFDPWSQKWKTT